MDHIDMRRIAEVAETYGVRVALTPLGVWYDVPDNAVVKEKNRFGRALVWAGYHYSRGVTIRCFLPGTWS